MLQKLKITTYVFILCLFGLTLITVSPVFAESFEESARVLQCEQSNSADEKANCYKEFARSYYDAQQSSADIKEHNRLNSGNYVKRKNGNVERKKAKDYAKDSAIAGAVNSDPRMKMSGGYSYCDFDNLPGEKDNIYRTGFPSSKAMAMCEGAKIAACKGKNGKKKQKCKKEWAKGLEVFLSYANAGPGNELQAPGGPMARCRRGFDGKCMEDPKPPVVKDVCDKLRRGKIKPNAANYRKIVQLCKDGGS
jgi:hypothetical protein